MSAAAPLQTADPTTPHRFRSVTLGSCTAKLSRLPPEQLRSEDDLVKRATIRAIGISAGTAIPKPMLEGYHLGEGDTRLRVEREEGILIPPLDPGFEEAMAVYAEGAMKYRNALGALAR